MTVAATVYALSLRALCYLQTNYVKAQLEAAHPEIAFTLETMKTMGDKILDVALAKIGSSSLLFIHLFLSILFYFCQFLFIFVNNFLGDKGLFTKELELGMLHGHIDMAVHSLKDLPTRLPEGLMVGAILEVCTPPSLSRCACVCGVACVRA
jgi:hydroxymethylbilane synthase